MIKQVKIILGVNTHIIWAFSFDISTFISTFSTAMQKHNLDLLLKQKWQKASHSHSSMEIH